MNESASTCSLDADDYRKRLAEIRTVSSDGSVRIRELPDGVMLTFRDTEKVRDQLTAIIRAESECCPFLELEMESQGEELLLRVSGPQHAIPLIREVTEAVAEGAK